MDIADDGPFSPAPLPISALGRHRQLSPTAGIKVSPLALGAMSIGKAWNGVMGSMDKVQSFALLDKFYELGGNFIDTANIYQDGESEMWLGEWMQERGNRDEMVIATKYTSPVKAGTGPIKSNVWGNHKKSMRLSIRDSLKNLKTDYVDLFYVHWLSHDTSMEEMMQGLHQLVVSGQVLYLGASDLPAWLVSKANQYARDHALTPFCVYQGCWSVMQRDFEREIIGMAQSESMGLVPWNAVGGGKFQTTEDIEKRKAAGDGLRSMFGGDQSEVAAKISAGLSKVAGELGIKSITAVALAYVMQKDSVPYVTPLVGGRKIEHLLDNIQALEIVLTPEHYTYLESIIPFDVGFPLSFNGVSPAQGGAPTFNISQSGHYDWVRGAQPAKPDVNIQDGHIQDGD
ncbi:hypothetical protein RQP46_007341 [Phenoliferia psychrophenolica]